MRRTALTVLGVLTLLVLGATSAAAHVTVNPSEAAKGSFAKLTFRVPNESDTAATIKVEVAFPEDHTFNARVKPVPGWTVDVEADDTGTKLITWSGGRIEPGQFQEFDISGGPLPDDVDSIEFKAVQTYDDGEVVRWIDSVVEGEEEPEHPAPTLTLVEGDADGGHGAAANDEEESTDTTLAAESATSDDDGGTDAVAVAALVVAVIALLLGGAAFVRGRRTS